MPRVAPVDPYIGHRLLCPVMSRMKTSQRLGTISIAPSNNVKWGPLVLAIVIWHINELPEVVTVKLHLCMREDLLQNNDIAAGCCKVEHIGILGVELLESVVASVLRHEPCQ